TSQRDVKSYTNCEQDHEIRARQIEVVSNGFLKQEQKKRDDDAACPRAPVESSIDCAFPLQRGSLRDKFCGNDLEGKGDGRYQNEESVNSPRMTKGSRTKESCNCNVVGEVDRGGKPGSREQYKASRQHAGLEGLRFRDRTSYVHGAPLH